MEAPARFVPGRCMGRGNWIPVGYEVADYGGFYVEINEDNLYFYDDLKQMVVTNMRDMYPSLDDVSSLSRDFDGLIVLENSLVQIVLGDNETSIAVYVIIPCTEYFPHKELGRKQLKDYLAGLQMILLKYYPDQVRVRTGPWTSGVLRLAM